MTDIADPVLEAYAEAHTTRTRRPLLAAGRGDAGHARRPRR